MTVLRSLCALTLLLVSADASRAQAPARDAGAPGEAAPTARTSEDAARRARVYARFGDTTLTVGEIEDAIAEQSGLQRQRYHEDRAKLRELAQRLVETKLLAAEARRRGLARDTAVHDIARESSVQLLVRRQFDERITPQSITDADVLAHYQAHMDEFSRPEMVRASQIVVATEADARALLAEVRTADASRFRQLARERSLDDETKLSGGDLRYFTRDGRAIGGRERPVDTAIVTAAFAIPEVGELVPAPVPLGNRFSVIKLTGRRPAETTPIEQARESIRRRVWRERRQAAIDEFVAGLRRSANVTLRVERLRAIRIDDQPSALGADDDVHDDEGSRSAASPTSMSVPPTPRP